MGRAERRRAERMENRKDKIVLTHEELDTMLKHARNEATRDAFDVFATCMAVKDIRKNGYGKKRIIDNLQYLDMLMNKLLDGDANFADYKQEVADKGVVISCKGREVR